MMADELVPKDLRKQYTKEEILEIEKEYLAPAVAHYYEDPVLFVNGEGATLEDSSGNRYIDLFAGICTTITGYNHPKYVATIKWQAERLVYTSSMYATVPYAVLVKRLAKIAPVGLTQSFIVNSGSEANEAALFMARKYTNNPYIVACSRAYHGRTTLARELPGKPPTRRTVHSIRILFSVPLREGVSRLRLRMRPLSQRGHTNTDQQCNCSFHFRTNSGSWRNHTTTFRVLSDCA
jgi:4-aminobutyrate aminotransferase-like enzyme